MKPFCFVLMPFGQKPDENNRLIDFDRVYAEIIEPAVASAELDPVRADKESVGGIIHKPMFERLMLCDYAVADLTTANANVFYELGVRHGIRPYSTVLIFAQGSRLPFDVAPLRGLPYRLDAHGVPEHPDEDRHALAERLKTCRSPVEDSPLFQLVTDWPRPDIARLKTDKFRDVVEYSRRFKDKLSAARRAGADAVRAVERELNVADADPAIVVDLFLSYRAVKDWDSMVKLVERMSPVLARTVMVRAQPTRPSGPGGSHPAGRYRRARGKQRDQRTARAGLQGSLGGSRQSRPTGRSPRMASQGDRNLFGRIHGRHSRCVSGRECSDVDGNG